MSLPIPLMYFDGRPFTRAEANAAGWSDDRLTKLVTTGLLRRPVQGVYVDALVQDTIETRAAAVCLVAPPDAVICRRTAAWLYGVDAFALRDRDARPVVDCVRPPKRRSTRHRASRGHSQTLLDGDVVDLLGLRVTSPLATAVHLARHLDPPFDLSAVDAMLHLGLIDLEALQSAVRKYPRHPGIVKARTIASIAEPLAESPGESWLRLRVLDAGFPRPQVQVAVRGPDRRYRIDIAFREPAPDGMMVGLEYDSDQWHTGQAADLRDATRQDELRRLGWNILSVRRGDVWGRDPALEYAIGDALGIEPRLPRPW
jgi:REase_MTES_1575